MLHTFRIIVEGTVQGVFYRQSTKETANHLGITGIVKNLPDGNVEIIATGFKEPLQLFIDWCKEGPPRAVVDNVLSEEIPLQEFEKFSIQRF